MLAQEHYNKLFKVIRLIFGHYSNAFATRVELTEDTANMGVGELSYYKLYWLSRKVILIRPLCEASSPLQDYYKKGTTYGYGKIPKIITKAFCDSFLKGF